MNQKKVLSLISYFFLLSAFVALAEGHAETIRLKNGQVLEGKIIADTPDYLKLDTGEDVKKIPRKFLATGDAPAPSRAESAGQKQVVIYVVEDSQNCLLLETFLKDYGISYIRRDIQKDPRARKRFEALAGPTAGLPLIEIGEYLVSGYKPQEILNTLRR